MSEHLFLSDNGYEHLESYLTQIYGDRGSARNRFERYMNSPMFQSGCRWADNLDDIPELPPDQIKAMIGRQNHFKQMVVDIQKKYDELNKENKLTRDDYYEIAGIMGLCPGRGDWMDTLFPYLMDLFVSSEEEGKEVWEQCTSKPNIVSIMVDMMMGALRGGQIIRHNGHYVFSQGYARNYFRGENAYNKKTSASLFRKIPSDPVEKAMHNIIGTVKMIDFCLWLAQLSCVKNWSYGDVFHSAIAQHYGIPTSGIDVTSDLKVALFFACCRFDSTSGTWMPLKNADFENKDSRANVSARGGDSRYGILFSAQAAISDLSNVARLPEYPFTPVVPVGYQPFMRCPSQSAYMVEAGSTYDMFRDPTFAKIKFRHTEELCRWIYDEMDGGKKIYPIEGAMNCEPVAQKIRDAKQYTTRALEKALELLKIDNSKAGEIITKLESMGYTQVDNIEWCPKDTMEKMDEAWSKMDYCEQFGVTPSLKIQFCI